MFRSLGVELGRPTLDDTRIAAQSPLRQSVLAEFTVHASLQIGLVLPLGSLKIRQVAFEDTEGMGKTESIDIKSFLLTGRLQHERSHGVVDQQTAKEFSLLKKFMSNRFN